jgi:hypothetical protein
MASIGLQINSNKTKLFSSSNGISDVLANRDGNFGVFSSILTSDVGLPLLGTFLGSTQFVQSQVGQALRDYSKILSILRHFKDSQIAFQIVNQAVKTRPYYLIRVTEPWKIQHHIAAFDESIQQTISSFIDGDCLTLLQAPSISGKLLALPISLGGGGFRRCSDIMHAAYSASLVNAMRFVAHHFPIVYSHFEKSHHGEDLADPTLPFFGAVMNPLIDPAIDGGINSVTSLCAHIIQTFDISITQRILTRLVDEKNAKDLENSLNLLLVEHRAFAAMWRSYRADKSTALWMSTYSSTNPGLCLTNREFSDNLRTRLLLPTIDPDISHSFTCSCCPSHQLLPQSSKFLHHMTCSRSKYFYAGRRHFVLKSALRSFITNILGDSGHLSHGEFILPLVPRPSQPDEEVALRSDFRYMLAGHYRYVDVGVASPISQSYIVKASTSHLVAASSYANAKKLKYQAHYSDLQTFPWMAYLQTFILETTGAFGQDCNAFLRAIERNVPVLSVTKSNIRKAWRQLRLTISIRFAQINSAQYRGTLLNLQPVYDTQDAFNDSSLVSSSDITALGALDLA